MLWCLRRIARFLSNATLVVAMGLGALWVPSYWESYYLTWSGGARKTIASVNWQPTPRWTGGRLCGLACKDGRLSLRSDPCEWLFEEPAVWLTRRYPYPYMWPHPFDNPPAGVRAAGFEWAYGRDRPPASSKVPATQPIPVLPPQPMRWEIGVPVWFLMLFLLAPTAKRILHWRQRCQRRRRIARDLCPDCGYDLRASLIRCPECGRERAAVEAGLHRSFRQRLVAALTSLSLLICLVALGLWARSYRTVDTVWYQLWAGSKLELGSHRGYVYRVASAKPPGFNYLVADDDGVADAVLWPRPPLIRWLSEDAPRGTPCFDPLPGETAGYPSWFGRSPPHPSAPARVAAVPYLLPVALAGALPLCRAGLAVVRRTRKRRCPRQP